MRGPHRGGHRLGEEIDISWKLALPLTVVTAALAGPLVALAGEPLEGPISFFDSIVVATPVAVEGHRNDFAATHFVTLRIEQVLKARTRLDIRRPLRVAWSPEESLSCDYDPCGEPRIWLDPTIGSRMLVFLHRDPRQAALVGSQVYSHPFTEASRLKTRQELRRRPGARQPWEERPRVSRVRRG